MKSLILLDIGYNPALGIFLIIFVVIPSVFILFLMIKCIANYYTPENQQKMLEEDERLGKSVYQWSFNQFGLHIHYKSDYTKMNPDKSELIFVNDIDDISYKENQGMATLKCKNGNKYRLHIFDAEKKALATYLVSQIEISKKETDIDFDEEIDIEDEEILADNMIYCSNWTFFDFNTIVLNDGTEDEELVTLFPDEITYFKYDEILKTIYLTHENVGYVLEVTNDEQIKAVDEIKELLNEKQYYTNRLSVEEQRQIINTLSSSLSMNSKPEKDASVIGRAVAGGIIAGPAGAVVGALSAAMGIGLRM